MHLSKIALCQDRYPTRDFYPFNLPVFQATREICFRMPVTFFVGENGTGKSTLLKAIAKRCEIPIWKGDERIRYHYNKFEETLHECLDITWVNGSVPGSFFASEIFQNFARILDEWAAADPGILKYFGGDSLMTKSHGQCHLTFFKNRFKIKGLYLLDEPENALSPKKQLELLSILKEMSLTGLAQFIIATHSPLLLAYPEADIFSFDHVPVMKISYEDTDYYRIYKDFMNNKDKYLAEV